MDEDEILNGLAPSLRREVLMHLLGKTVAKIQIFSPFDVDTQLEVQPMLKPMVREAKEVIFGKNAPGLSLFFLLKGRLSVRGDMDYDFCEIAAPGAAFGEHSLMRGRAVYACVAKTRCELYALSLEDVYKITLHKCVFFTISRQRVLQFICRTIKPPLYFVLLGPPLR